jgi:hypothetical protein
MCFLEGFWDFVLRFFFPLYLQYLEDHLQQADDGGKVWKAALAGVSAVGYCRWTTTMWIHIAKFPFWQRGNSNEMEQRVGEPDRVIEEIQVFHRRSQLWGTQCCKPGVTWNLHAAIWLKLETLKWHWILGTHMPHVGDVILCMDLHMPITTKQHFVGADICVGWIMQPALMFHSEVFTSWAICASCCADMCNDHKTEAAVALKMEKYLSWESQSQPQTGKEIWAQKQKRCPFVQLCLV